MKVLDTLTNKVTIFNSIDEAAQSIDCSVTAIRKALQNVKEKGAPAVSRLLKRRYIVATDNFSANNIDLNEWKTNAHRVEVVDTLTGNKTLYLSIREAASAIGVVESTVRNALKNQMEKVLINI